MLDGNLPWSFAIIVMMQKVNVFRNYTLTYTCCVVFKPDCNFIAIILDINHESVW